MIGLLYPDQPVVIRECCNRLRIEFALVWTARCCDFTETSSSSSQMHCLSQLDTGHRSSVAFLLAMLRPEQRIETMEFPGLHILSNFGVNIFWSDSGTNTHRFNFSVSLQIDRTNPGQLSQTPSDESHCCRMCISAPATDGWGGDALTVRHCTCQ